MARGKRTATDTVTGALGMLADDHRQLDRMLEGLAKATTEQRETLFEGIKHELDAHAAVEEEIFYAELQEAGRNAPALVEKARNDHFALKTLCAAIQALPPEDPTYAARLDELARDIRSHAREEEETLFPLAEGILGPERLREMEGRLRSRKAALRVEMADTAP